MNYDFSRKVVACLMPQGSQSELRALRTFQFGRFDSGLQGRSLLLKGLASKTQLEASAGQSRMSEGLQCGVY